MSLFISITESDFGLFKRISLLSLLRIKGFPADPASLIHQSKIRKPQAASDVFRFAIQRSGSDIRLTHKQTFVFDQYFD